MYKDEWKTIVRWATEQHTSNPDFWDDYSIGKGQWFSFEIKKGCCNADWVKVTYKDLRRLKRIVKFKCFFKGLR